ncbi:unnamed protein product [marine sediment metagenome]|uniref:Uncharacterized protein n=1 Tax=marine sediment metagenome TaxID=412755 RepID=X1SCL3_9ZZZZ
MEERKELDKIPSFCDFFESRKIIMTEVMRQMNEKRAKGQIVTNRDFGRLVRDEWGKMKEKQKTCPL